jgi:hypothetical protein
VVIIAQIDGAEFGDKRVMRHFGVPGKGEVDKLRDRVVTAHITWLQQLREEINPLFKGEYKHTDN